MNSFYGGPNGQSFEIAKIFRNKVAMEADLQQRWQSSISIGAYVFIAYGLPSDPDGTQYNLNKQEDIRTYQKTYNSTLWQKIYTENTTEATDALTGIEVFYVSGNYGLGYRLIASCTGNTPTFSVLENVLNANENPRVEIDNSDVDNPKLTFYLPHSYEFEKGNIEVETLHVNENPSVQLNTAKQVGEEGYDENVLAFKFSIPRSQVIEQVEIQELPSDQPADVRLDIGLEAGDTGTIDNPILKFSIPVAPDFSVQNLPKLDADQAPTCQIDKTDPTNFVFQFSLPQSQVMDSPDTTTIDPSENPNVSLGGTINSPKLLFNLPRAVKFYYGSLLGQSKDKIYVLTDQSVLDYKKGDYYINASTGFIYIVTETTDTQVTFEYVACLQAPLPEVSTEVVNPFSEDGSQNILPLVESSFENPEEKTGWKLNFKLPKQPIYQVTSEFIGAAEQGDITVQPINSETIRFAFKIAQGSRIFNSRTISPTSHIEGSKIGDICLNPETGEVYEQIAADSWKLADGTLKGPVGSALRVAKQYIFTSAQVTDTLAAISALIEADYGIPKSDEIIAVTYQQLTEAGTVETEIAYWYFYSRESSTAVSGEWGRVQLTGGVSNLIENEYIQAGDTNKTYSITYINGLIGGTKEADDKKTFSKAQVLEMLSWGSFADLI